MEKIFKARWWDYSTRKFNINGRICLETLIPFGIAGTFIIYIANPFFLKYIEMIPEMAINIILGILLLMFFADMIVSFKIVLNLKEMSKEFKDNTVEISETVKKIIKKKSRLYRRLVGAFPRIKETVAFNKWDELKKRIEESKEEVLAKFDNSKEELRTKIDNSKAELREKIDTSKQKIYKNKEK